MPSKENQKWAIIPDIHNKTNLAEFCAQKYEKQGYEIYFLGDYFDSYDDDPSQAAETARWLKKSLTNPNRHHLGGNHDFCYAFPNLPQAYCPGWSKAKQTVINEILGPETLQKLDLYAVLPTNPPILLTHAGITLHTLYNLPTVYDFHPANDPRIKKFENTKPQEHLLELEKQTQAWRRASILNQWHHFQKPGSKMEEPGYGGPYWLYLDDIYPIAGLIQIIGHNRLDNPATEDHPTKVGRIFHIDCGLHHVALVTPTSIKIESIRNQIPLPLSPASIPSLP